MTYEENIMDHEYFFLLKGMQRNMLKHWLYYGYLILKICVISNMNNNKIRLTKWHRNKDTIPITIDGDVGEDSNVFLIYKNQMPDVTAKWSLLWIGDFTRYDFPTQIAAKEYAEILALQWIFNCYKGR